MNKMKVAWNIAEIGANRFGGCPSEFFQKSLELVSRWAKQGCSEKVILNRILLTICAHVKQRMKISYWLDFNHFFISEGESCQEILNELERNLRDHGSFHFQGIEYLSENRWIKWGY